jgi:hypothetical protein
VPWNDTSASCSLFQNCHRVAAFDPAAVDGPAYRAFTSPRNQLLNQSPERRNC